MSGIVSCDEDFMQEALKEALIAKNNNEVPIGAVITHQNNIIARAHNMVIGNCDPTAHAEIVALREGAAKLGNYRLLGCTLYVTLEPCQMCFAALVHARVARLVFGSFDSKPNNLKFNHSFPAHGGVLANEAGLLLAKFFQERR